MHFNALRQLDGPFAMGMCKRAPVERCSSEHSKRNLVSRLCRCTAGYARTDERDCRDLAAVTAFPRAMEILLQNYSGAVQMVTNGALRLFRLRKGTGARSALASLA